MPIGVMTGASVPRSSLRHSNYDQHINSGPLLQVIPVIVAMEWTVLLYSQLHSEGQSNAYAGQLELCRLLSITHRHTHPVLQRIRRSSLLDKFMMVSPDHLVGKPNARLGV